MSEVVALGYLGLLAPDVEAWRPYATDVLGLAVADRPAGAPTDHLYLRMDERGWRFAVEPAEQGGLAFTGWEVSGPAALRSLEERLRAAGVDVVSDPDLAKLRQVGGLVRASDPDGNRLEFFYGAFVPKAPFVSPRGAEFVTGKQGLGHIVVLVDDLESARRFYLDLLGFRISDVIVVGGTDVIFTHVNPRHHSFAFVEVKDPASRLNHFMLQANSLDMVGRTLDLVLDGAAPLTQTFGRHTNDEMTSFYMRTPSGFEVEYGCEGRTIDDDTWVVSTYDEPSFWGHRHVAAE